VFYRVGIQPPAIHCLPMAHTLQDLADVDAAIVAASTGKKVNELRFGDRWTKYQEVSITELRKLRDEIAQQLAPRRVPLSGRTWQCLHGGKDT